MLLVDYSHLSHVPSHFYSHIIIATRPGDLNRRQCQHQQHAIDDSISSITITSLNRNRFKYIEPVDRGADDASGDLRMPVDFLDVLLALVHEQELGRDVFEFLALRGEDLFGARFVLVLLDREVPDRDLFVGA